MSFSIPPLPGESLVTPRQLADRAGCSTPAIYNAIRDGRIAAVTVAGRTLITESEADRFIREWPTRNKGISARWREYREWKAALVGVP